ncbi:MAG TPA: phospholipase D-like domain-containing protein [Albitalea sp.]|uniref:phospholipase D-like domain-containing protein n=1 Tax=Piscinibacter sp. TaxID=1903157 RepID=UPI002ED2A60A
MGHLLRAQAFCNSEVAFIAWAADGPIDGCLGFMVTRVHLDANGMEIERRVLPTWVAFKTQSNPDWEPQDASVWPIQKFSWRDLTLRRSRDKLAIRPLEFSVKYEIAPVGLAGPGRAPVPASATAQPGKYKGTPIPLHFCGAPIETNTITVTQRCGDVAVAFTNGILSTQNLRKQLKTPAGKAPTKGQIDKHISKPGDAIREFLAGDVLPTLRLLFQRAADIDGKIHLALYELEDAELVDLLLQNQARLELILTTAGSTKPKKGSGDPVRWDVTNQDARAKLAQVMGKRLHNRWFNNSAHIGHNKFAILVSSDGVPEVVWTGSTNWTKTGLCAQTNNTIIVNSSSVAAEYMTYWNRLLNDKLPIPNPQSAGLACNQGAAMRSHNATRVDLVLDGAATGSIWFSPNTEKVGTPATRRVPADLAEVFQLMKRAQQAIFFLVFNPGRTSDAEEADINTVVAAGIDFGRLDPQLLVSGAISDPTAVPGYTAPPQGEPKPKVRIPQLAIFRPPGASNVLVIRAAAINDLVGDFDRELLSAGHAIIHDKIVVIDPMSETDCAVITGSHNLGFKASYANDENMLVIRGNRPLALAYAAHVLDVYEHYKFRAALEQQVREALLAGKKAPKRDVGKGFLNTDPGWQDPYFSGDKGREGQYFLSAAL